VTHRRLFFAFWPDDALRQALSHALRHIFPLSGRPVQLAGVHVTAAFLGAVSESRLEALTALCGPVPPLTINFDRLEHWLKPRVLVAVTSQVPDELQCFVDGLWQSLDRLGFTREARPFRPHITLARDVRSVRPGLEWEPCPWPVKQLELIESLSTPDGVTYRPVLGTRPG